MVNLALWLALGAMLGWLANHLFRLAQSPLPSIGVGMAGALILLAFAGIFRHGQPRLT